MCLAKFAPCIINLITGSDKAASVADHVVGIAQAVTGASTGQEALAQAMLAPKVSTLSADGLHAVTEVQPQQTTMQ